MGGHVLVPISCRSLSIIFVEANAMGGMRWDGMRWSVLERGNASLRVFLGADRTSGGIAAEVSFQLGST